MRKLIPFLMLTILGCTTSFVEYNPLMPGGKVKIVEIESDDKATGDMISQRLTKKLIQANLYDSQNGIYSIVGTTSFIKETAFTRTVIINYEICSKDEIFISGNAESEVMTFAALTNTVANKIVKKLKSGYDSGR